MESQKKLNATLAFISLGIEMTAVSHISQSAIWPISAAVSLFETVFLLTS